ncbi:serine hydrolase [Pollutibacter soli]|uniref:serine hydrolase domain-containing protein n=1 Tax=Pollutibacter soli TaxID=3034157 RepID=UPI003013E406
MRIRKLTTLLLGLFLIVQTSAQTGVGNVQPLIRSTPEKEGVSSKAILDFVNAVEQSKNEFHSFMLLRHGKVIAESWWNPYRADLKHTMYSCSKSFTATAIGFCVAEKRLTVNAKVIAFFPNDLPDTVSANLAAMEVKDLLSMSAGQEPEPNYVPARDTNWVRGFLAAPVVNKPGTKFLYNSIATYMLSAIVTKVTGQSVIDYLRPRLFDPLGISDIDWETDPRGINTGGWGLRIRTEDLAKFGQLFLQKGDWKGTQILPASWIEEASTKKIMQNPNATAEQLASNDWLQGYCYQMWRCRNNAYRGDGAYGQYIIVMPDQDAVISITSETNNMQDELNLIFKYLLPALQDGNADVSDKASAAALKKKLASLSLPAPKKISDSAFKAVAAGKSEFKKSGDQPGFKSVAFDFTKKNCVVTFSTDSAVYPIGFSASSWKLGKTNKKGAYLVARAKNNLEGLAPFAVAGSYRWLDAQTLQLTLRYIESPHTETYTCKFDSEKVDVEIGQSFNNEKKHWEGTR